MRLLEMIAAIQHQNAGNGFEISGFSADPEITSLHYRSGEVLPGGLFIALKGAHADGHQFVSAAAANGAAAVVISEPCPVSQRIATVRALDTRKAMAALSAEFYGRPSEKMTVIGVTGTNGKTTTAFLIEHLLIAAGLNVGVIGTINYRYLGNVYKNPLTTPESMDLQRILGDMQAAGVTHVVMEVSSHGVALERITDCCFDIGVFTNLTQDHLDFHKDMDAYWACKKRFFTDHLGRGPKGDRAVAVVNAGDPRGGELIAALSHEATSMPVISVGQSPSHGIYAEHVHMDQSGISATVLSPAGRLTITSRLVGRFNLDNILCALGVGAALGLEPAVMERAVASFDTAPGRLERVSDPGGRHVFVDYAHTPDALANVLSTLKEIMPGRLICIFGCGGDRDKTKRPLMGGVAARLSDLAIVTSDNPRSENPEAIIADILAGVREVMARQYQPKDLEKGFKTPGFAVEPDRAAAIALGIRAAGKGDTVLIAGKGHEPYQLLGDRVLPFDDREKAAEAMAALQDSSDASRAARGADTWRDGSPQRATAGQGTISPQGPISEQETISAQETRKDDTGLIFWTTADILAATGGELLRTGTGDRRAVSGNESSRSFERIFIDSRDIPANGLFVAITGERHDGHMFVRQALEAGVRGFVIQRQKAEDVLNMLDAARDVVVIGVDDTTGALGDLAAYHRRRIKIPVVAVTGSNGKTSTREMIAAVLGQKFNTLSTAGNFNNEIGLPLTLLRLDRSHEAAVVEMGMNHPGEIFRLSKIGAPDVGVITNIGSAHLEGLGSLEAVMAAKAEITAGMADDAPLILNGDDPFCRRLAESTTRPVIFFGTGENAHVRAEAVSPFDTGSRFTLRLPEYRIDIELKVPGAFMVTNALAAAAAGHTLGATPKQIKAGLESFAAVKGRMNLLETAWGGMVIDDTYNANPDSMAAAIRTLISIKGGNRALVVAGDMLELGENAPAYHEQIGRLCAEVGIARIFATGRYAKDMARGAQSAGMPDGAVMTGEKKELMAALADGVKSGDRVLVKGSRSMGMETMVKYLMENVVPGKMRENMEI